MKKEAAAAQGSRYGWIGLPMRPLLLLLVLVLLVHFFILRVLPMPSLALAPNATRAFSTRTLTPPPPVAAPAPVAVAPIPKPKPKPKPRPAPLKPAPVMEDPSPTPAAESDSATAATAVAEATDPSAAGPLALASAAESAASAAQAAASAAEAAQTAALEAPPQHPPKNRNTALGPVNIPGSLRIKYDVFGEAKKLTYRARSEVLWQHDGSHYTLKNTVSAFLIGSRTWSSEGDITPEGLAPRRFSDNWRKELAAHFERDKGRVIFSANTPEAPLLSGAQDRMSLLMQLSAMFAGASANYPPATTISMQIIGPRDAEVWLFTVNGPETLSLPNGQIDTLKVSRNPRKEFDQTVEVWFSPSQQYLPVRLKITQANGDYVDQRMLEIEAN
ncbi:DUF3108 domain-containing protein [Variovorax sp. HJSM1_2]|uniref:DUF3108 domain-containing protein n=1 Tax=Variovorax sp. HJSM1_2 TaxID=3366263 RepID=UPI003BD58E30